MVQIFMCIFEYLYVVQIQVFLCISDQWKRIRQTYVIHTYTTLVCKSVHVSLLCMHSECSVVIVIII